MNHKRVLVLVGSLRKDSINRQLAQVAVENAPTGVEVVVFEGLADIPHYNEDLDGVELPPSASSLRAAVDDADAVLLVSPENNGTISSSLKNAIDWLSRPYGASAITGKPTAVIGASAGSHGGIWAVEDTRKAASVAQAHVLEGKYAVQTSAFDGRHPREHAATVTELKTLLGQLADATTAAMQN